MYFYFPFCSCRLVILNISPKGSPPERGPLKRLSTPPFLPVVFTFTPARSRSSETTRIKLLWCVDVPPPRECGSERRLWPCASTTEFPVPPARMRLPMYGASSFTGRPKKRATEACQRFVEKRTPGWPRMLQANYFLIFGI